MIAGKTALVTGGASGLGAEICKVLAREEARLIIADVAGDRAEALAAELRGSGAAASSLHLDLADIGSLAPAIAAIADDGGGPHILINNAGIDRTVDVETLAQDEFDAVIAVNLRAPFALARAAFAPMKAAGGGHIVNVASTAAKRAWANAAAYHASKWGLLGLSHALHVEGRPHGIKVTALVAGGMRTPFILERFPGTPLENLQDPAKVAEMIAFVLKQGGDSVVAELTMIPLGETSWP